MAEIRLKSLRVETDEYTVVLQSNEEIVQVSIDEVWCVIHSNIGDDKKPLHVLGFVSPSMLNVNPDAAMSQWLWEHAEFKEYVASLQRIIDRYE